MNTRIRAQDWFGIRFCAVTPGSQQLRQLFADPRYTTIGTFNQQTYERHLNDTKRRHYLLTGPALAEMALLPIVEGFDFSLLDQLPVGRGCLLFSATHFIRYEVTPDGLYVVDVDAKREKDRSLIWSVKWAEGMRMERSLSIWPSMARTVQALTFLHYSQPEYQEYAAAPADPSLAARLLNPKLGNSENETQIPITKVGKGWNHFLLDTATGKVRGHVRLARVGKGWEKRRLIPVRPHERTRKVVVVEPKGAE